MQRSLRSIMLAVSAATSLLTAHAATKTWNTNLGYWSVTNNWTDGPPGPGDDVIINNTGAVVLLTESTPWLGSLTIAGGSLSCSNWGTTIYATNITIGSGAKLTCAGPVRHLIQPRQRRLLQSVHSDRRGH